MPTDTEFRLCSVPGCDRKSRTRGMCTTHVARWYRTGDVGSADIAEPNKPMEPGQVCSVESCDSPARSNGWCQTHASRAYRNGGDPGADVPVRKKGVALDPVRACVKCGQVTDDFSPQRRVCKDCVRAEARERARIERESNRDLVNQRQREYRARNLEAVKQKAADRHLKNMGLTRVEFDALLSLQGGKCAICECTEPGGMGRWHVDHDHNCDQHGPKRACHKCIRGLLCFNCNVALGYLSDSPIMLLKAADYLLQWERI